MNTKDNIHTFAILAYKESPYLEECILSLQKQTVKSNIFISTSTPSSFLNKLSKKFNIPIFINERSSGIGSDWSFAYYRCTTKYVTLAHQDDIYWPRYTELCLSTAEKGSGKDLIIFTNYNELYNNVIRRNSINLIMKRIILLPFLLEQNISAFFLKKIILYFINPISCSCVMYNKDNIGHFEFSTGFLCSLDWEAWLRLSRKNGRFIYLKKKLMLHRIHKASQAFLLTKNKVRNKEEEIILEKLWPRPIAKILAKVCYIASQFE